MAESGKRKPKGAKGEAWGILNPYGDLWTWQSFDTEAEALEYIVRFWRGNPKIDLRQFKPVRVKVHTTVARLTAS